MLQYSDIKFDCALYSGYKPCRFGNQCRGCPHYEPLDREGDADMPMTGGTPANTESPPRVAIIKTGALGDVLRTTTLLHPIHRAKPGASVTWITAPAAVPLLHANPLISELTTLTAETLNGLAAREFDVLYCFEKEELPLALAGRIRATKRFGFGPNRVGRPVVFNPESEYALLLGIDDELKFRRNTKPYPQIICEMAALPYRGDPYVLELTAAGEAARARVSARLAHRGAAVRVGINTGCGGVFRTKQWPEANLAELAGLLLREKGAAVLLLGGAAERELNAKLAAEVPGLVDTGCDNSLDEFFGIVDACDVVVTSDSLAMHIAIARGKRTVVLFGSTSATEIELYGRGEKVAVGYPCSPCYQKYCSEDLDYNAAVAAGAAEGMLPRTMCMEAISGAMVRDAVMRQAGALVAQA